MAKDYRYVYMVGVECASELYIGGIQDLAGQWGATLFGDSEGDTWIVWFGTHFAVSSSLVQDSGYSSLAIYFQNQALVGAVIQRTLKIDEENFFDRTEDARIQFEKVPVFDNGGP